MAAIIVSVVAASASTASAQGTRGGSGLLTGGGTPLEEGLRAFERSRYAEARDQLEKAKRGPKRGEAWLALGRLALVEGKHQQAIDAARQAARSGGRMRF